MNIFKTIMLVLLAFSALSFADEFTTKLESPDYRTDDKNFLSGPEHWFKTVAPVEPQLPDTRPITKMHKRRTFRSGKVSEHWESCDDACGPGCGNGKLMEGCKVLNGLSNPKLHTWKKTDGKGVTCGYEVWECKTHPTCMKHDKCLLKCKTEKPDSNFCQAGCHFMTTGVCSLGGGWIKGDPIDSCWDRKLTYSRVIPDSCREN